MLCCYQAIRILISRAADDAGTDPRRVSFSRARDGIRSRLSDPGSFPPSGTRRSLRRPGLRDHLPAQPRPRGPAAATQRDETGGRPVQDPQAGPEREADAANRDQVLADASSALT